MTELPAEGDTDSPGELSAEAPEKSENEEAATEGHTENHTQQESNHTVGRFSGRSFE